MVARGTDPGKQWIHSILYFRILIQWNIYQNTFLISGKSLEIISTSVDVQMLKNINLFSF